MKLHQNLVTFLTLFTLGFLSATALASEVKVYKSPYCGCCKHWVTHLEKNGFKVIQHSTDNMSDVKNSLGVATNLASCHTAIVDGYVIEGHVPASDIKRLLTEKPKIYGLTVPGMPAGQNVPGMETKAGNANFDVLVIDDSMPKVFSHYE